MIGIERSAMLHHAGFPDEQGKPRRDNPNQFAPIFNIELAELIDFVDGKDARRKLDEEYFNKAMSLLQHPTGDV